MVEDFIEKEKLSELVAEGFDGQYFHNGIYPQVFNRFTKTEENPLHA